MKKSSFESLVRGLEDAIAWARSEPNGCAVHAKAKGRRTDERAV